MNLSIEEQVDEFIKSEPMEHVLGIETTAMVTGRANQYEGETIGSVLTKALQERDRIAREEVMEKIQEEAERQQKDFEHVIEQANVE